AAGAGGGQAQPAPRERPPGLSRLYTLGPLSAAAAAAFGIGAHHHDRHADLAQALAADIRAHAQPGLRVLVKGSRGSAMDRIVAAGGADGPTYPGDDIDAA